MAAEPAADGEPRPAQRRFPLPRLGLAAWLQVAVVLATTTASLVYALVTGDGIAGRATLRESGRADTATAGALPFDVALHLRASEAPASLWLEYEYRNAPGHEWRREMVQVEVRSPTGAPTTHVVPVLVPRMPAATARATGAPRIDTPVALAASSSERVASFPLLARGEHRLRGSLPAAEHLQRASFVMRDAAAHRSRGRAVVVAAAIALPLAAVLTVAVAWTYVTVRRRVAARDA